MGLVLIQARFKREAPQIEAIKAEIERQLGTTASVDSIDISDDVTNILLVPDAVVQAYVAKAIIQLGGECVDGACNPTQASLPGYVSRPWPQWPLWRRVLFRIGR
jgi:hypothetical protein